jgi:hypothetical protein
MVQVEVRLDQFGLHQHPGAGVVAGHVDAGVEQGLVDGGQHLFGQGHRRRVRRHGRIEAAELDLDAEVAGHGPFVDRMAEPAAEEEQRGLALGLDRFQIGLDHRRAFGRIAQDLAGVRRRVRNAPADTVGLTISTERPVSAKAAST